MKKIILTGIAMGMLFFTFAQSDSTEVQPEQLFDLSLEELLSYQVESATKSSTTVQKAPSVIRMYTKDDFVKFGFTTIQDVLNTVPGMQIQEYRAGHQLVWIRGVQARYNNKVLMLIDGVPMRESYYGNFNIDEMFPLEAIEKIEVLNGPGSVLYGANSFSGVINITTKKEGKSVGVDYGSFNSYSVQGEYDANGLYANGNIYSTDGFSPDYMSDGKSRDVNQKATGSYGLLKYTKGNLSVMSGIAKYGHPYKYRDTKKEYYFDRMPIYGNVKYKHEVNENSSINSHAYANYYKFNRDKIKFFESDEDTIKETSDNPLNSMIVGADLDYNLNTDKHDFIAGFSWQQDKAMDIHELITYSEDPEDLGREEAIIDPNFTRNSYGFFAQEVYKINDQINATGGIRYDVLSNFENQFNYRLGLTGQWETGIYAKLLYGTAYRVPSYREYITTDAPNLGLEPEYLKTLEAQLGYLIGKKADINLTFYNNQYSNFIQEIVVDSIGEGAGIYREVDDEMAFNWESRNISGLELNANIRPNDKLSINTGASLILNATESANPLDTNIYTSQAVLPGNSDIVFLSKFNAYVASSYTFAKLYTLGINASYFGDREVPSDYQADSDIVNADNSKGFMKFDLIATARFLDKKLTASVKIANLLDAKIFSPPYTGSDGYDVQWQGRTLRFSINYRF